MSTPKRKILIPLIAAAIIISIFAWNQYQKSQNVNRYVSISNKFPPVTLLMRASSQGDLEQVQSLLDRGADVSLTGGLNLTALFMAVSNDHQDIAKLLLDTGANLNQPVRFTESDCTLIYAIHPSPTQSDYEFFTYLTNYSPHYTANHYCNIPIHTSTQGKPKYLELYLSSLEPESASAEVGGVQMTLNMRNNWHKKFKALDPDIQQQINDILSKYE